MTDLIIADITNFSLDSQILILATLAGITVLLGFRFLNYITALFIVFASGSMRQLR